MADTVPKSKRKAIWWSSEKNWAIDDYYYTGSRGYGSIKTCTPIDGHCPPVTGPPYGKGYVWEYYYSGGNWKETTDEVIVDCISF